jgi:hypothetical protein
MPVIESSSPFSCVMRITVLKSQAITVDKAVCNISAPKFASGLSYVAVSRVRTLDGLMFEAPFDRGRIHRDAMQLKLEDYESRKLQTLDARVEGHSGNSDPCTTSKDNRGKKGTSTTDEI